MVQNTRRRSSPGFEQIDYNMISALPVEYLQILLDIYNDLLETGLFPVSWHHSLVFLIPKSAPGRYRLISLTSCLFVPRKTDLNLLGLVGVVLEGSLSYSIRISEEEIVLGQSGCLDY